MKSKKAKPPSYEGKYDAPFFIPHITVYGLVDKNLEELEKIAKSSIEKIKPFYVQKINLNYSDDFWKTLFIEIKQNKELKKINEKLTDNLAKFSKYEFLPHASLIYKDLGKKEKENLANTIKVKESFQVSKIAILDFSENIKNWKLVKEYKL